MDIRSKKNLKQFIVLIADNRAEEVKSELLANNLDCKLLFVDNKEKTAIAIVENRFDLIIVAQNLIPDELLALVKSNPQCLNFGTPLIALTETENVAERKKLIYKGFDDCITQSLSVENFHDAISLWGSNDGLAVALKSAQGLLVKLNNNKKLVFTLWQKLLEELPLQLKELQSALQNKDYLTAYTVVHKLNGSAKVCGLLTIETLATDLEKCLIAKNYKNTDYYYRLLQANVSAILRKKPEILDQISAAPTH